MGLFDFLNTSKGQQRTNTTYGFAPRSQGEDAAAGRASSLSKGLFAGTDVSGLTGGMEAVAGLGADIAAGAQPFVTGDFLDPSSKYNTDLITAATRPAQRVFSEQTLPGLQSALAKAGGTGSTRGLDLMRQAFRDFEEVMADTSTRAIQVGGQTRIAGFEAGAKGGSYAMAPISEIIRNLQTAAAGEFALSPHAVQTGGSATTRQSGDDLTAMFMLALGGKTFAGG